MRKEDVTSSVLLLVALATLVCWLQTATNDLHSEYEAALDGVTTFPKTSPLDVSNGAEPILMPLAKSPPSAGPDSVQPLQGLRLVFLGDSVTRYQYLSLAYFLRHKRWLDPNITVNNLVNAHSFHHPLHPDEDWNEFFLQSNRLLHPLEICDCLRSRDGKTVLERRYFYDADNENLLVYINMNGNAVTSPGRGYYGRLPAEHVFGSRFSQLVGLPFGLSLTGNQTHEAEILWDFPSWGDVIRYHIGSLDLAYRTHTSESTLLPANVLINAGLHPHNFGDPAVVEDMHDALQDAGLNGTWKTTTYKLPQLLGYQAAQKYGLTQRGEGPHVRDTDTHVCSLLQSCFNLSWTALAKPELYFDDLHFLEPVYRVLNEEYLDSLGFLPPNYVRLQRESILVDEAND